MNANEIAVALQNSPLILGAEIAARIQEGWGIECGSGSASSNDLRGIYSLRRKTVLEKEPESEYAARLVTCIDEMLLALPSQDTGVLWYWVRLKGANNHYLVLFNQSAAIAGLCLRGDGSPSELGGGAI